MIVCPLIRSVRRNGGGVGVVEGRDAADVRPQPPVPHPLDDLTQPGAIGQDDEVDRQAVSGLCLGRPAVTSIPPDRPARLPAAAQPSSPSLRRLAQAAFLPDAARRARWLALAWSFGRQRSTTCIGGSLENLTIAVGTQASRLVQQRRGNSTLRY